MPQPSSFLRVCKTRIDPGSGTHPSFRASHMDCFSSWVNLRNLPWGVSTDGFATKAEAAYPHPWSLLLKSTRPLHVTLCLTNSGHLVPCRSPQLCSPRAVPWPMISLKPLSFQLVTEHCAVILVRGPSQSLANLTCAPMARLKAPWPIRRIALALQAAPRCNRATSRCQPRRWQSTCVAV